jgi:hypothetical protein
MQWQDFVFTLGSLFFIVGLIPAIRSADKPPVKTSIITGFWLAVFAVVYTTLDLYLSASITAVTSACWWTLAIQKHRAAEEPFVAYSNAGSVG